MIALIAEKPSVAKDFARIIGATQKNDGYLSGNGYMVTLSLIHISTTELAMLNRQVIDLTNECKELWLSLIHI